MKILMISPANPFPADIGSSVRIMGIFRGLSEYHDVTLIFPKFPCEDDSSQIINAENVLSIACRPFSRFHSGVSILSRWPYHVQAYYSYDLALSVRQLLNNGDFSLVYCHFIYTLPYVRGTELPIVLDQHNVDREYWRRKVAYCWSKHHLGRYLFSKINLHKTIRFENSWLDRVQGIVSVSKRDSELTKTFVPNSRTRYIVAPNGVDIQHYTMKSPPADIKTDSLVLGFLGSLDLELNRDAAFILCKDILPRVRERLPALNVSVLIIGRNPPQKLIRLAERNPPQRITVTGTVDDVLPFLQALDILVLPLLSGAGTKLRVFEAMAAGVCIVGSELAFLGIDGFVPGKQAHKADSIDEFVETICYLAHKPALRRITAKRANELALNRYSWESISRKLSTDLADLSLSMNISTGADTLIEKRSTD